MGNSYSNFQSELEFGFGVGLGLGLLDIRAKNQRYGEIQRASMTLGQSTVFLSDFILALR